MAGAQNMAMFLVFRFFAGAGAFMILAAVPIWMSEVAPPFMRGKNLPDIISSETFANCTQQLLGALVQLHAAILVIGKDVIMVAISLAGRRLTPIVLTGDL